MMNLNKLKKYYTALTFLAVFLFQSSLVAEEEYVPMLLDGVEMETVVGESVVEPAILVLENFTIPDVFVLELPFIFNGELLNSTITISFNDSVLPILNAGTFKKDKIETLYIDIDEIIGQTGELRFQLDSNGSVPAKLYLIDDATALANPAVIMYLLH